MKYIIISLICLAGCAKNRHNYCDQFLPQNGTALQSKLISTVACGIRFCIPSEFREEKITPSDSCEHTYKSLNTKLHINVSIENFAPINDLTNFCSYRNDCHSEWETINGQHVIITKYYKVNLHTEMKNFNYVTTLDMPQMGIEGSFLSIEAYSKNSKERNKILNIFKTIRLSSIVNN